AAIVKAKEDDSKRKDVWVAAGTYVLSTPVSMQDSIDVYGGFAGIETAPEQRAKVANGKAWEFANPSILKGNESMLVNFVANYDVPTTLDGFTITDGNGAPGNRGGGVLIRNNGVLQNCIVTNCSTVGGGGGIEIYGSGAVRYCLVKDNSQTTGANGGGGIFCNNGHTSPAYIENCEITSNKSTVRGAGCGIQGNGYTYLRNCIIYNNSAVSGTNLMHGGGIYTNSDTNEGINNIVFNNTGTNSIYLKTKKFANNTVVKNIGGLYVATGTNTCEIKNNIVWACVAAGTVATSLSGVAVSDMPVQNNATYNQLPTDKGWALGDGNILFSSNVSNGDIEEPKEGTVGSGPKFAKVTSFIGAIDAALVSQEEYEALYQEFLDADWSLNSNSPCVNAGQNLDYVTSDITGGNRPQGFPFETAKTDIGAIELPYYLVAIAAYDASKGSIYNESGTELTSDDQLGFAKGAEFMLYFLSQSGEKPFKVTTVRSNNGGLTFEGEESDITGELDEDGLWTSKAFYPFLIKVQWTEDENSIASINGGRIRCFDAGKSIRIEGLPLGSDLSIYHVSGALAYRADKTGATATVSLPVGVYIVRAAGLAQKVTVK
ncbi:MAG: right-handed parallel beta-helix repeat-containing protein, partial [Prevotella sp.]|nr:right-handed parallel beta-helix repeat-containing protein [Prevotella sp.]